jgi:C-terminal processing protease CtpA/Prc
MNVKRVLRIPLLSALVAGVALAAGAGDAAKAVDPQVQRLSGLCRLWGTVKYFHPYLAYKPVDWDQALVKVVPEVKAAGSAAEYQAALDHLLSFLEDPATRTMRRDAAQAPVPGGAGAIAPAASEPSLRWPQADIALLTVNDFRGFTDPPGIKRLTDLLQEASKAKAVVFDIRRADADESAIYFFSRSFLQGFTALFEGSLAVPSSRHRMYSGYPTQTGGTSGGYYSGFVYDQQQPFKGRGPAGRKIAFVFVTNARPNGLESELSALQASRLAVIIREEGGASAPVGFEPGGELHFMTLPEGITAAVRVQETVQPDGSVGFSPDASVPAAGCEAGGKDQALALALDVAAGKTAIDRPASQAVVPNPPLPRENAYPEMAYPTEEYRLLALFRFWNVIDIFFPYKHLLDRPWQETLEEFIPRLQAAGDATAYALEVMELVTNIRDTHGFSNNPGFRKYLGTHLPAIEVKWIEGRSVVTHVGDGPDGAKPDIRAGDIVLAVDGEDIAARRERLGRFFAASTPQALSWRVHQMILAGAEKSLARLKLEDAQGAVREVAVPRTLNYYRHERTTPVYGVLPEGYGYMDLARLTVAEVDKAFEALRNTTAIIMDMRGYPKGTAWSIGPRLAEKEIPVAQFRRPEPHAVLIDWPSQCAFDQKTGPAGPWRYTGRIVVLINEEAISQAEHTCLFLEAAAGATFVGTPTNGANGDVTTTILPGGITVNFTGHDVRHADGRQLQRAGIQPDVRVAPTVAGLRAGRDEVLEKAVEHLRSGAKAAR